jgi:hypothetical protein
MSCDEEQLQILRRFAPLDDKRFCHRPLVARHSETVVRDIRMLPMALLPN